MTGRGLLIASPASHSGKTTVTLGIARALSRAGTRVRCAKVGPDYIDPGYLSAASGQECVNLDTWAMKPGRVQALADTDDLLIVEGAMGLFDGAPASGQGSSADLAGQLGLPVVLVVDCASMGQSIAAIVRGFLASVTDCRIAGLILNRVGSDRHGRILKTALKGLDVPILGIIPRTAQITRPSRHLGLMQASELAHMDRFLDQVGDLVAGRIDLDALASLAARHETAAATFAPLPPLGQRIAIAQDPAFTFTYPHILNDWTAAGASIHPFSPLADECPDPQADAIFLPGGYPELFAQALTRAGRFRSSMGQAAARGVRIYGECGGYMVLGHAITDARDIAYPMLGLLDLETSFASRKLHLGYRKLTPLAAPFAAPLRGHEFHYATTIHAKGDPLFAATDAEDQPLPKIGLVSGSVSGSFAHVIDHA